MKFLSQAVTPRKSVFDKARRDIVLDVTNLVENNIDPEIFFQENYITNGMAHLYQAVMSRLEGKSDDGVYLLSQSMGGGKTHNLITLGLLAKHPAFRNSVMGEVFKTSLTESVKVIGFTGRENPTFGIWGHIAEHLGKKEVFQEYYNPLQPPGQSAWINLLKDERVLILLDELPPYFEFAQTKSVGDGNLAQVTTAALSNLMVALGKPELKNVALIITDLSATNYSSGAAIMGQSLVNLKDETGRIAKTFTPVAQTGDEIYNILRTRLFESLPTDAEINEVADAYGKEIEIAQQMDLVNDTGVSFSKAVRESYPFHPGLKDLLARFKENPGFMQTRGLIRYMRSVTSSMFDAEKGWAKESYLIAAHDLDFSDADTFTEVAGINSKLSNAISHDIFNNGMSVAERIDERNGNNLASNTAKLILVSSLAMVQNGVRGLKDMEIIRNLCGPGVSVTKVKDEILTALKSEAWYLHLDNSGKFLFKDVLNVVAKLQEYVRTYNTESVRKEIQKRLEEIFAPNTGDLYQKVYALPAVDDIKIESDKVSLIVYQPNTSGLHPDLQGLYDDTPFPNRVLFLSGDQMGLSAIEDNARGLKAIEAILSEFKAEGIATNSQQYIEAEKLRENFEFKFNTSLTQTFVKIYYPTNQGLHDSSLTLKFTNNKYEGEGQIIQALTDKRKFTTEITSEVFRKKAEQILFAGQKSSPWNEVRKRAATNPRWDWHKPGALDQLKERMVQEDQWRNNNDWIEIGPFPPPKTSVQVHEIKRDDNSGEITLRVKPKFGTTVFWEVGENVTTGSSKLDTNVDFVTTDMVLSFLCVDETGKHETGTKAIFKNRVSLKYQFFQDGATQKLRLEAAPKGATIRFSTNGADPKNSGGLYEEPTSIPPGVKFVLACAEKNGIESEIRQITVPDAERGPFEPDRTKPAIWHKTIKKESTAEVFAWLKLINKHKVSISGITVELADNSNAWVNLEAEDSLIYSPDKLGSILEFVQTQMQLEGSIALMSRKLHFLSGQHLLDYVKDTQDKIADGNDVKQ